MSQIDERERGSSLKLRIYRIRNIIVIKYAETSLAELLRCFPWRSTESSERFAAFKWWCLRPPRAGEWGRPCLLLPAIKETFKQPTSLPKGCSSNHELLWLINTIRVFVEKKISLLVHRVCRDWNKKIIFTVKKVDIKYIFIKLHRYLIINRRTRDPGKMR